VVVVMVVMVGAGIFWCFLVMMINKSSLFPACSGLA